MALTLSEILGKDDGKIISVNVPEWGGDVCLRVMSGAERDEYESFLLSKMKDGKLADNRGLKQKLLTLTLCDEKGVRMVDAPQDAAKLFAKSASVLQSLFEKAQIHNGLRDEDVEAVGKN
jgi:hypothetical protein